MNNSIFIIKPYRYEGQWVFDDPAVGLVREPFVGGADTIIDVAAKYIHQAENGFIAMFSAQPFPGANLVLNWIRAEAGGNVYRWAARDMEGWLCPALLKYFQTPPESLYVQFKPANGGS